MITIDLKLKKHEFYLFFYVVNLQFFTSKRQLEVGKKTLRRSVEIELLIWFETPIKSLQFNKPLITSVFGQAHIFSKILGNTVNENKMCNHIQVQRRNL